MVHVCVDWLIQPEIVLGVGGVLMKSVGRIENFNGRATDAPEMHKRPRSKRRVAARGASSAVIVCWCVMEAKRSKRQKGKGP